MRKWLSAGVLLALAVFPAAGPVVAQDHTHTGAAVKRGDRLWFGGARVIPAGQVVEGDVVVASGSLTVRGEVHGDVVVGSGDLVLEHGALVYGDAVVTGGTLANHGARVLGQIHDGRQPEPAEEDLRQTATLGGKFVGLLGAGSQQVLQVLALGIVLLGIGLALVAFGLPYLSRVSDVVRRAPYRAMGVGLAANVLLIPAFIAGAGLLGLTIVGIPLILPYVPLFWMAAMAVAAFGTVAVALAVGERRAERRGWYDARHRNPYAYLTTGLLLLLAPLMAAQLAGASGLLGSAAVVLSAVAWVLLWLAASAGFGAAMLVGSEAWRERRNRRALGLDGGPPAV